MTMVSIKDDSFAYDVFREIQCEEKSLMDIKVFYRTYHGADPYKYFLKELFITTCFLENIKTIIFFIE